MGFGESQVGKHDLGDGVDVSQIRVFTWGNGDDGMLGHGDEEGQDTYDSHTSTERERDAVCVCYIVTLTLLLLWGVLLLRRVPDPPRLRR